MKGIIFDLDGTLLDTLEDIADSLNHALKERNLEPHPVVAYKEFVGDGLRELVYRALPPNKINEQAITELVAAFKIEYGRRWHIKTRPYPGIVEMLQKLAEKGIVLNVLSNKPHAFTVEIIEHFFKEIPFKVVFGGKEGYPLKPDPHLAWEICRITALSPAEFYFVGDSEIDIKTAENAEMSAIGVSWGFRNLSEFKKNTLVTSPAEILKFF